MSLRRALEPVDLTVLVIGTSGAANFNMTGNVRQIAVIPPNAGGSYDLDLSDAAGFGVDGRSSLTGNYTMNLDAPCVGIHTITISNAGVAGSYRIRLRLESGI